MRTITHVQSGPVRLALNVAHGLVTVDVGEFETAEVTLRPLVDDDTAAQAAIRDAVVTSDGSRFGVRLPRPSGDRSGTVVSTGRGVVSTVTMVNGGMVVGSVNGVTIVNGRVITGGAVLRPGGGVAVAVRLPIGSSLAVDTVTASVETIGRLAELRFESTSGDLLAPAVGKLHARTTSGDVTADVADTVEVTSTSGDVRVGCARLVSARTMSGDVRVNGLGGEARVRTMSGDIDVHAVEASSVDGESMSGDVTVTAASGVAVEVTAHTMSGRVRTPRR